MNSVDIKIAFDAINSASATMAKVEEDAKKHASGIGGAIDGIGDHIHGFLSSMALFNLAVDGIQKLVSPLKAVFDQFSQGEAAAAQTAAVLKSTGNAAGVTAAQVADLATAMSKTSLYEDDMVQGGINVLLTFKNIGGSIMPQTTRAVLDFATAMHLDVNQAALQVGKSLNDPIEGMTKLQREGVTFTQAQKDLVKQLVETGRGAEAQKIILAELASEFGGSAAAATDTFTGKLQNLKKELISNLADAFKEHVAPALNDFLSLVTGRVLPALEGFWNNDVLPKAQEFAGFIKDNVVPVLESFWDWIENKLVPALQNFWQNDVLPKLQAFGDTIQNTVIPALRDFWTWVDQNVRPVLEQFIEFLSEHKEVLGAFAIAIGIVTAAWVVYTVATTAAAIVTATLLSPIALVVLAIAGLGLAGYELVANWGKIWQAIQTAVQTAATYITGAAKAVLDWLSQNWGTVLATALLGPFALILSALGVDWQAIAKTITDAVMGILGWLHDRWDDFINVVKGPWEEVSKLLGPILEALFNKIGGFFKSFFDWVGTNQPDWAKRMESPFQAFANDVPGLVEGALSKAGTMLSKFFDWVSQKSGKSSGPGPNPDSVATGADQDSVAGGILAFFNAHPELGNAGQNAQLLAGVSAYESGLSGTNPFQYMGQTRTNAEAAGVNVNDPQQALSFFLSNDVLASVLQQAHALMDAGGSFVDAMRLIESRLERPGDDAIAARGQGALDAAAATGQAAVLSGAMPRPISQGGMTPEQIRAYAAGQVAAGYGSPNPPPAPALNVPGLNLSGASAAGIPGMTGAGAGDFNLGKPTGGDVATKDLNAQTTALRDLRTATELYNKALNGVKEDQPKVTQAIIDAEKASRPGLVDDMTTAYNNYASALSKLAGDAAGGANAQTLAADTAAVNSAKELFTGAANDVVNIDKQINTDTKTLHTERVTEMNNFGHAIMDALKQQSQAELDATTLRIDNERQALKDGTALAIEHFQQRETDERRFLDAQERWEGEALARQNEQQKEALAKQYEIVKQGLSDQNDARKAAMLDAEQASLAGVDAATKAQVNALNASMADARAAAYAKTGQTISAADAQISSAAMALRMQQEHAATGQTLSNMQLEDLQAKVSLQTTAIQNAATLQKKSITDQYQEQTKLVEAAYKKQQQAAQDANTAATTSLADSFKQQQQDLTNHYNGYLTKDGVYHEGLKDINHDYYTGLIAAAKANEKDQNLILDRQLKAAQDHFHDMTTTSALEGRARLLLEDGNQKAIVNLLQSYNPEWKAQGISLGQQMIDGIQEAGLADYVKSIFTPGGLIGPTSPAVGGGGLGLGGGQPHVATTPTGGVVGGPPIGPVQGGGPVVVHVYLDGTEVTQHVTTRMETTRRSRVVAPGALT